MLSRVRGRRAVLRSNGVCALACRASGARDLYVRGARPFALLHAVSFCVRLHVFVGFRDRTGMRKGRAAGPALSRALLHSNLPRGSRVVGPLTLAALRARWRDEAAVLRIGVAVRSARSSLRVCDRQALAWSLS